MSDLSLMLTPVPPDIRDQPLRTVVTPRWVGRVDGTSHWLCHNDLAAQWLVNRGIPRPLIWTVREIEDLLGSTVTLAVAAQALTTREEPAP